MNEKLVKAKFNIYLRNNPKKEPGGILVPAGTILKYMEIVKGELVDGINDWYKNEESKYFWSGGVEKVGNDEAKILWPLEKLYKRITTPFSETWIMNKKKQHTGIDIAAPVGEKVFAVADGVVEKIGYLDAEKKMAQYVDVNHLSKNYCTAYLHINPIVKRGDVLKVGDIIGHTAKLIDMGSHLHFNLWKGAYGDSTTHRGALPKVEHASEFTDPVFPSNFIDPMTINYS